jgi:hypothetical protein
MRLTNIDMTWFVVSKLRFSCILLLSNEVPHIILLQPELFDATDNHYFQSWLFRSIQGSGEVVGAVKDDILSNIQVIFTKHFTNQGRTRNI